MHEMVERYEDMSPDGKLRLIRQEDGDVIIVVEVDPREDSVFGTQVEFCTHGGGGQSPRTLKALVNLMEAMKQDNEEALQYRD